MKVRIKKLNDNSKIPTQAHSRDFCYDVYATACREVEPGIWAYSIGLAFEIVRPHLREDNYLTPLQMLLSDENSSVKLSIDFRPRSSIWKTGLILSNCEGTIDELYRGEVLAYFYEVVPGKEKYKIGDRIGQIKLGLTLPIEFEEVKDLNTNTERGINGFGSTGR